MTKREICPIYWKGKFYEKLSDISESIRTEKADEESIIRMLKDGFLSWKLKNTSNINQKVIDALTEIKELSNIYPKLGYYVFMYRFAPDALRDSDGYADDVFNELIKMGHNWYKAAEMLLKNDRIFAYLFSLGFKNNIIEMKKAISGNFFLNDNISDILLIYKLFDGICKDKSKVREHYLKYGPLAYIHWLQQNLNLYSFNSATAKEIERRIKDIAINKKMSISEIYKSLSSLNQHLKDFLSLFQNNYLLTFLGLQTEQDKSGITTSYTYAYFDGDFFGVAVPIGFLKSIGR
jgi:hypothetical protein